MKIMVVVGTAENARNINRALSDAGFDLRDFSAIAPNQTNVAGVVIENVVVAPTVDLGRNIPGQGTLGDLLRSRLRSVIGAKFMRL